MAAANVCGKCLKVVLHTGQKLKSHLKTCAGFPKDDTTSLSDQESTPPATWDSPFHSSKCSKGAKSDSAKESTSHTKESGSHKEHKKSHKKSKNQDNASAKDKQDKDNSKSNKSHKK